jgi:RNA polymerase sigma factor (sigma-70 family)
MRRLSRLSDEQLSRRLAAGEAAAFDELYRRYAHRLAVYGRQLLGDGAGGEDVAQVALLNAYQALRKGVVVARVRPWLYRIARNAALDMLSRRRELLVGVVSERDGAIESDESERGLLIEALRRLPKRQCQAWILREVNGLKIAEIAARLELRTEQVEQVLFAARNSLAEEIAFGERLDCESVRRLGQGPLARSERRALRRHLRTCPDCRSSVSLGGGLGALVPLPLVALVRQLAGALDGVGGPAATTGAVLATAAVVGAVPLAGDVIGRHDPVRPAKAIAHRAQPTSLRRARTNRVRHPTMDLPTLGRAAPAAPARVRDAVRSEWREKDGRGSFDAEQVDATDSLEPQEPSAPSEADTSDASSEEPISVEPQESSAPAPSEADTSDASSEEPTSAEPDEPTAPAPSGAETSDASSEESTSSAPEPSDVTVTSTESDASTSDESTTAESDSVQTSSDGGEDAPSVTTEESDASGGVVQLSSSTKGLDSKA